jgi:hypothetical protein
VFWREQKIQLDRPHPKKEIILDKTDFNFFSTSTAYNNSFPGALEWWGDGVYGLVNLLLIIILMWEKALPAKKTHPPKALPHHCQMPRFQFSLSLHTFLL